MPSNTSTSTPLPPPVRGGETAGGEGKQPYKESKSAAVEYDPPPASWFFGRGSTFNRNPVQEQKSSEKNSQEKDDASSSSSQSKELPFAGTNDRHGAFNQSNPNTDFGMVSDNDEDDDSHEGFNFIAVSKSLLMSGPSYDPVPEDDKKPPKAETDVYSSEAGSENHRGVLIVDGCDIHSEDGAPMVGSTNNPDASMLTVPGSDSLPSEIGSISSADGTPEQGGQNQPDEAAPEDLYPEERPPMIHRFLKNLQQNRRLRVVSDASDENGGDHGSGVSIVRNNEDDDVSFAWTMSSIEDHFLGVPRKVFWRRWFLPASVFGFLLATAFASHSFVVSQRNQREAWEQQLQQEKEAMARILAEKESLRHEVELLVEEAAVATARAESLVKEQERLILQQQEAEKAEKERLRLLKEEEEKKQKDRQRRREQPWRSSNDEDFGWFFDGSDEHCSERRNDRSTSFTIADNCWIKAKADLNLGSCSSDTKDYFKDLWSTLLGDWEFYFDDPTHGDALDRYSTGSSNGNVDDAMALPSGIQAIDYEIRDGDDQQNRGGGSGDYQDDTYYPPQDPLQDLFSVIQSAGQSFVNKVTNLMSDEVEASQTVAREMEETVSRRFSEASQTISNAMEIAKEDMRDVSKETLSAIHMAVQKIGNAEKTRSSPDANEDAPPTTQQVTMKGLFDAAATVTTLFESVIGENPEK